MPEPSGSILAVRLRHALPIALSRTPRETGNWRLAKSLSTALQAIRPLLLALNGAVKDYEVHLVMPRNVSQERKALVGAIQVARQIDCGAVVTVLPDDGSKYVSLGIFY
jgi:hypothetical protein